MGDVYVCVCVCGFFFMDAVFSSADRSSRHRDCSLTAAAARASAARVAGAPCLLWFDIENTP